MVDDAAEIKDYDLEDGYYSEAWNYLLSRFDNKRTVIKTLFRQLYNLESTKSDRQIRSLLDKIEPILRGLRANNSTGCLTNFQNPNA